MSFVEKDYCGWEYKQFKVCGLMSFHYVNIIEKNYTYLGS